MSTRPKSAKTASHTTVATEVEAAVPASATPAPAPIPHATQVIAAPALPAPAPVTPPAPPAPAVPVIFIAPPPASANIPSTPDGFEPTDGANFRGTKPQKAELVALPLAVKDLRNFTNYAQVIGGTAPPQDEVLQIFDVTNQWSTMRNATSSWDEYAREQEGIAWTVMRPLMERLKQAFDLAATTNASIGTTYTGLKTLLSAKTASAQKAVSTKKANKKDVAAGKEPTHGQVGKKLQKAAAKAALAAQRAAQEAEATTPNTPVVAPSNAAAPASSAAPTTPAPPVASAAPVASPVFVVSSSAVPTPPASPAAVANGVPPVTNGAAH